MIYENKFGKIKIELENLNNKTIGIAMSGGADSTLLCCLLANTIKEKGLDKQVIFVLYNNLDDPCNEDLIQEELSGCDGDLPSIARHLYPLLKALVY